MKNKLFIFDCDGTVLDTFELIEHIVLSTFKELDKDYPITLDEAHSFFGPFINDTFQKYVTDKISLDDWLNTYQKYADLYTEKYLKEYPGIKESLTYLKSIGYKIVVFSNKISKEVKRGLEICKMDHLVDLIIGAECVKKAKPDPEGIFTAMKTFNVSKCVMIGDTFNDIKAGKNAGVYTCGVTWCKTTKEEFTSMGADEVLENPIELKKLGDKYGNYL